MKNSKVFMIASICLMTLLVTKISAQNSSDESVPVTVVSALKQKYPNAEIKNWKIKDNFYTAKIKIDGKTYYPTFNKNGNWINTTSKISWSAGVPAAIRSAYRSSEYSAWNMYKSEKIDTPTGEFYELMVDNTELITVYPNKNLVATEKSLKYKANGILSEVNNISVGPNRNVE